ncbi:helix-turn-helix domain-containing protein [Streptomyces sp. NPDC001851]|uniref:AraC-like ligand-binding domain-containing protein n=1 Tax=Streptomyces sp. NPDC001851 TaxID=3154529 RepID=UPI00332A490A
MKTVFSTDELPVSERTEAWVAATTESLVPNRFTFPDRATFGARLQAMPLGASQLCALSYAALYSRRTPALIRQSDPEHYQVGLIRSGRQGIDQARRRALVGAGDLVLYDSSRPFDAVVPTSRPRSESLLLQFPKNRLPLPERQIARLLAVPIPGSHGVGRLLADFLGTLAAEEAAYTVRDRFRLEGTAIDLVAATLAHHLDRDGDLPPESRQHVLFMQISAYIEQHLADPDLGPARLAAVHHISLRHLHRIFQERHTTVAGLIRQTRLDRCRRDLADPAQRGIAVHTIAARWGFQDAAAFSRTFRTTTGCSPTEYRAACLTGPTHPSHR